MDELRGLHPRPQMTRPDWTDLNGRWGFAYDDADVGLDRRWYERDDVFDRVITVPFPPESSASGIGDRDFHPVVWYRRSFSVALPPGERLLLHFGAVDYRASVWVNGRLVAVHEGGHTPFSADVTAVLADDGENVLTVRAEDPPADLTQPRGKQDWLERPHGIFYERTTGIWQPVWLEPVPATHIASRALVPRPAARHAAAAGGHRRADAAGPAGWGVRLSLHGQPLTDDTFAVTSKVVQRDLALDPVAITHHRRRYLWTPEHPNLVEATITLASGGRDPRRGGQLRRAAQCGLLRRTVPAQRPSVLPPDGARPELLAGVPSGRAEPSGAARGGGVGQAAGLQRRADPPEDRGPPVPVLVRPAGRARLGRDAQRPGLRLR